MHAVINKVLSVTLAVTMMASQLGSISVAVAGTPGDDLKQIQYKYYFRGKYEQAVTALVTYLARTDLAAKDEMSAREFLAASYVLSGDPTSGQEQFARLLASHHQYSGPDPAVFKTEVITVYERARDDYASTRLKSIPAEAATAPEDEPTLPAEKPGKPLYKRWWFYAGIATALLIAGAVSKEKGDDPAPVSDTGTVVVGVRAQ